MFPKSTKNIKNKLGVSAAVVVMLLAQVPLGGFCDQLGQQKFQLEAKGIPKTFDFFFPRPVIVPTQATVEFEPGVPPDWPKPPGPNNNNVIQTTFRPSTTSNKPSLPTRRQPDVELVDTGHITYSNGTTSSTTGFPMVLNPNYTHQGIVDANTGLNYNNSNNNNRASFIDWLLGLLGIESEKPENLEPPKNCAKCTCGMTYKNKRIVGGVETQVNQYPWMTALMYNNRFYCGASLINNRYLLTAAHCVNGFSKERLSAVFLDHDRSNHFETQTFSRSISKVLRHRSYGSGGSYNNDIALLRLDREVSIANLLNPVCLPPVGKSFTNHKGIVVGWGATQVHGQISNKLREVEVPIMSNIECRRTGYGNKITENMMCAGYPQGTKDSCQGDSGGPLHVINNSQHQIVGIVSWGEGCAEPNYPGVYTRVNRYYSWIKSNTRDACYC